jgi:hypothetical protein
MLARLAEIGHKRKFPRSVTVMGRQRPQLTELENFMNKVTPFLLGPLGGAERVNEFETPG